MYTPQQVEAILDAARDVISNASNEGCTEDLTVTSQSACERLQEAVDALQPHTLAIGMHTHGEGVSLYPYLAPRGRVLSETGFVVLLGETFERNREEFAEVTTFPDREIELLNAESDSCAVVGTAASASGVSTQYIGDPVRRVLLPNGKVVPIDEDGKIEAHGIEATIYQLVEQGQDAVEDFLAELVAGNLGNQRVLYDIGYFVEGRTETGALILTVTGTLSVEMREALCKKCGTGLRDDGFCPDDTCAYSDWLQTVSLADLTSLSQDEIASKYDTQKRIRAPG